MTPMQEHRLYLTDRWAWAQYVAPKWARTLAKAGEEEKRRLWRIAGPELKDALRVLKAQSSE